MKKITIFFMLIASFVFCLANPAYATKYDWQDPNYNFQSVKQVMVANLSTARVKMDSMAEAEALNEDFIKKSSKLNFRKVVISTMPLNTISAPAQENTQSSMATLSQSKKAALQQEARTNGSDVYVVARLNKYKIGKKLIPAHTEWKEKEETRIVHDSWGRAHEETEKIEYPVQVPDTYEKDAIVQVLFDVYNTQTGKAVFSREESRTRNDSDDPEGVYKRIVDSFFSSMKNLMKHNKV